MLCGYISDAFVGVSQFFEPDREFAWSVAQQQVSMKSQYKSPKVNLAENLDWRVRMKNTEIGCVHEHGLTYIVQQRKYKKHMCNMHTYVYYLFHGKHITSYSIMIHANLFQMSGSSWSDPKICLSRAYVSFLFLSHCRSHCISCIVWVTASWIVPYTMLYLYAITYQLYVSYEILMYHMYRHHRHHHVSVYVWLPSRAWFRPEKWTS